MPGYRASVATNDPVPEADRLEQELPAEPEDHPDARGAARPHADASEADAFEQELPLADAASNPGIDAERSEPLDAAGESTGRG